MKNQVSAAVLIIIVLLGVSANSAVYAQIITPQQPTTDAVKPVQTINPNSNSNNNIQPASIDLNIPAGSGQNSQGNFLINCPTGVVIYQPSLTTNEIVPICVTSEMLNSQLFKIDVEVKDDNKGDDNDDNDHDGNDHHKKHFKHYPVYYNKNFWNHYWSNTHTGKINNDKVVLTDPRDDPKYDSIDWRSDDGKSDLSIQEMDKILEDQQNKKGDTDNQGYQPIITTFTTAPAPAPAPTSNQNTDTIASNSGDGVENTDDNGDSVETQESAESTESGNDSSSDSSDESDGGESGDNDGGDSSDDSGSENSDSGSDDSGGESDSSN